MIEWAVGELIVIVGSCYFFAALVKGVTGLGFSTTCLPLLALALGIRETLPLLLIPSVASNLMVMRSAGGILPAVRRFWPLFAASLPGIVIGLALLVHVDADIAATALGGVLTVYAAFVLLQPAFSLPERARGPLMVPTGFLTGLFNGLTGSQVMPLLPYLLALRLTPNGLIQASNCSFTLSSCVMAIGLVEVGFMTWTSAAISLAGLLPVWVGVSIGSAIRQRLAAETFRRAVLVMLILLGLVLVARPFF